MMRKSDSDKGPITNGSSKSSTNSPNTPKRSGSGKKHRLNNWHNNKIYRLFKSVSKKLYHIKLINNF